MAFVSGVQWILGFGCMQREPELKTGEEKQLVEGSSASAVDSGTGSCSELELGNLHGEIQCYSCTFYLT